MSFRSLSFSGSSWGSGRVLTYNLTNVPSSGLLSRSEVVEAVNRSLQLWADEADVEFRFVNRAPADINIRFVRVRKFLSNRSINIYHIFKIVNKIKC